jgi:lysophospholipase L1-like esterase
VRRQWTGAALLAPAVLLTACTSAGSPTAQPASPTPATSAPTATTPGTTRPLHVVGLGDSVMSGFHCGCDGIVEEYAAGLARRTHRPVDRANLGGNGLVTDDLLTALTSDARTRELVGEADVVLVTIGANDLLPQLQQWQTATCDESCYRRPADEMGRNLGRVLMAVHALRADRPGTVLVTNYWNVFTDGDAGRSTAGSAQVDWSVDVTTAANAAICRAVHASGDTCVDLVRPFKGDGTGDPTPLLAADGDHPDAAGVQAIVQALLHATPAS